MLTSLFSASLVLFSITAAFPTPEWASQLLCRIDQTFLKKEPVHPARAGFSSQELSSSLAASSPVSLLYQFKEMTVLENLAARYNGHLLLTTTNHPHVYYFDPRSKHPSLLYTFPESTSTLGIVEATPDVFLVIVGNFTAGFEGVPGSFGVWSMDLNENPKKPIVTQITTIPEADALNGMAMVEGFTDLVLISDSSFGAIWRVNVTSGTYDMVIRDVLFTNCTASFPLGINGISTYEGYLYFVNSAQRLYGRVLLDDTGSTTTELEIITHSLPAGEAWDDLALDWAGSSWIATHPDAVTQITLGGKQRNITADHGNPVMIQPTSLIFGRGSQAAERTLYVVTAGEFTPGGKSGQVFAIDTRLT